MQRVRQPFTAHPLAAGCLIVAIAAGCSGAVGGGPATPSSPGFERNDAPGANLGGANSGSVTNGAGANPGGGSATAPTYIPVNIRKLTNAEYDTSVKDLLGIDGRGAERFADDVRNAYYTPSMLQRVDETRGDQLQQSADELATRAVAERFDKIVTCQPSAGAACATQFVRTFATRAFRRPVSSEEQSDLEALFSVASTGGTFKDGVSAVITAVLQSASFLYVPALGNGSGATRNLTPYEVASALSYFVIGAPPDDKLLDAAAKDMLNTSAARVSHFRRLVKDDPRARVQLRRFVREWLGTDELSLASPVADGVDYNALRPHFEAEADAFIDEVMFNAGASLTTLLAADFTMADATLASYYKLSGSSPSGSYVRAALGNSMRRGIMTQGAFLVAHASRDHSSPVKRGVTVLRRLLCRNISFPTGELAATAMQIPVASPSATTRERFARHSSDARCSGCHAQIDPLGFAFEHFDQAGRLRMNENGKAIDPSGELVGTDVDGAFDSTGEFLDKLSKSETVHRCFARNLFRFASAVSSTDAENSFLAIWEQLDEEARDDTLEVMSAYVASDLFVTRSTQ